MSGSVDRESPATEVGAVALMGFSGAGADTEAVLDGSDPLSGLSRVAWRKVDLTGDDALDLVIMVDGVKRIRRFPSW